MHRNHLIAEVLQGRREAVDVLSDMIEEEGDSILADKARTRRPTGRKLLKLGLELVSYPIGLRLICDFYSHALDPPIAGVAEGFQAIADWSSDWEQRRGELLMAASEAFEPVVEEPRAVQETRLKKLTEPWFEGVSDALYQAKASFKSTRRAQRSQGQVRFCLPLFESVIEVLVKLVGAEIAQDGDQYRRKNNDLRERLFRLAKELQAAKRTQWLHGVEQNWQISHMIEVLKDYEE